MTTPDIQDWQLIPADNLSSARALVCDVFQNTYHDDFADAWMGVNHQLHVELRGFKYVEGWLTGFLLTPWMLSSLYIPVQAPAIIVEHEWQAAQRKDASYVVIGPLKTFEMGGKPVKANLNYDIRLGHYLLQPLVQRMDKYADNDQAFGAWAQVIEFRQAHYAKLEAEQAQKLEAAQQAPVSRRDFLAKWRS